MIRTTLAALTLTAAPALAQTVADMTPREGWEVLPTAKGYAELVEDTKTAVEANGLAVVTEAGPTEAAAGRGVTIPGNRVIGAFNNDFAVRILEMSTPAMIEAPVRLYVTENADGTATLSYKAPTAVFAPYAAEAEGLAEVAAELDAAFAAVAQAAVAE